MTRTGRRSPALVWEVTDGAGEVHRLSGLERRFLSWVRGQHANGRHRWTIRGAAQALECAPSSVTRALRRTRSLSLVAAWTPARGRNGGVYSWNPSPAAVGRDRLDRLARWPTRGNVATLNTFRVYPTREGLRRAYRAASGGRPPAPRPPGGGPAGAVGVRARGRGWPPPYLSETCPSRGHRVRLPLRLSLGGRPDQALVFAGGCPRCGAAHASAVVLAGPDGTVGRPDPRPGDLSATAPALPSPAVSPARALAAAELLGSVDGRVGDRLRVDYLGWRRQALHEPILPAVATAPADGLEAAVSDLERRCRRELELVAASRRPLPPEP